MNTQTTLKEVIEEMKENKELRKSFSMDYNPRTKQFNSNGKKWEIAEVLTRLDEKSLNHA